MIEKTDRDAFASVYRTNAPKYAAEIERGEHDGTPLIQAFAAHRQAAFAAGMEQAAEIAEAEGMPWAGLREGVMFARLAAEIRAEKDKS